MEKLCEDEGCDHFGTPHVCHDLSTFEGIRDYIESAPTPAERQRRKAETFHITYGSRWPGKSYAGTMANYMLQSQHAQPLAADFTFVDEIHDKPAQRYLAWLGTMTGRLPRLTRPKVRRKIRRLRAQKARHAARKKLAGANDV
jgi:folate-dependent tRNA-U54 methylase TrmFO/GidA